MAIEHPKDADEAAAVVLSEIVPSLPSNLSHSFTQSWNKSSGRISEREGTTLPYEKEPCCLLFVSLACTFTA